MNGAHSWQFCYSSDGKMYSSSVNMAVLVSSADCSRHDERQLLARIFTNSGGHFLNVCKESKLLTVIICEVCPWQSEEAVCRGDSLPLNTEKHHLQSNKVVNYLPVSYAVVKCLPLWGQLRSMSCSVCILKATGKCRDFSQENIFVSAFLAFSRQVHTKLGLVVLSARSAPSVPK